MSVLAVNLRLSAFAAEHRAAALLLSAPTAADRYLLPTGRSAANPPAVDRWDRRTNRETLNRYTDPAPLTMQSVLLAIVRLYIQIASQCTTVVCTYKLFFTLPDHLM